MMKMFTFIFLLIVSCAYSEVGSSYHFNNGSNYRLTLFLDGNPIISSTLPFYLDFDDLGIPEQAEGHLVLERPITLPVFGSEFVVIKKKEGPIVLVVNNEEMGKDVKLDRACVFKADGQRGFKNMKTLIAEDSIFLKEKLTHLFGEGEEWQEKDHSFIKKVFGDAFFSHLEEKVAGGRKIGKVVAAPFSRLVFMAGEKTILVNLKQESLRFADLSSARPLKIGVKNDISEFIFDGLTFSKDLKGGWKILANEGWVDVFDGPRETEK